MLAIALAPSFSSPCKVNSFASPSGTLKRVGSSTAVKEDVAVEVWSDVGKESSCEGWNWRFKNCCCCCCWSWWYVRWGILWLLGENGPTRGRSTWILSCSLTRGLDAWSDCWYCCCCFWMAWEYIADWAKIFSVNGIRFWDLSSKGNDEAKGRSSDEGGVRNGVERSGVWFAFDDDLFGVLFMLLLSIMSCRDLRGRKPDLWEGLSSVRTVNGEALLQAAIVNTTRFVKLKILTKKIFPAPKMC